MARLSTPAFIAATLLFFAAPGHPDAWFSGMPVGIWTLAILAIVAFAWAGARAARPKLAPATAAIAVLIIAKLVVGAIASDTGWLGRYYANGDFSGAPQKSTEFPCLAGSTRIDRAIDFHDDYLPVYFLNDAGFNRGIRREVTEPVSVEWIGHVHEDAPAPLQLSAETRGTMRVAIDGAWSVEAVTGHPASLQMTLTPGDHLVQVRYVKPADTDPLVRLAGLTAIVTPVAVSEWRLAAAGPARVAARGIDLFALLLFGAVTWMLLRRVAWSPARIAAGALLLVFIAQGLQAAQPLQHRAVSLSGGDDWLGFEARSRAVATGDVLMLYGQPLGKADVFYYYPGYSYFLAIVHAIGGEDLSTPIFVHFLLLFGANVLIYGLAVRVFDRRTAMGALVLLFAIEELAFIRHYTVTLLSENLYFLTSTVTIDQLVRFAQHPRRRHLVWAGLAGGVSALARPAMMLYLVPAALTVAAAALRARRSVAHAASAVALFAAVWIAAVLPATVRNYVAAGSPVLISTAPAVSFINYNLPPNVDARVYRDPYVSGKASAAQMLLRIVVEHPIETIRGIAVKLGFSLGFLELMGGYAHPELILASLGYFLALLFCPAARALQTWPIHAFVLAHLTGMVLTMPSNYGYRLILPMYLLFPMFAVHFALESRRWAGALVGRRAAMTAAPRSVS